MSIETAYRWPVDDKKNTWASLRAAPDSLRTELGAVETIAAALAQLPDERARARVMRWAQEFVQANDLCVRGIEHAGKASAPLTMVYADSRFAGEQSLALDGVEVLFDNPLPPPLPSGPRKSHRGTAAMHRLVAVLQKRGTQAALLVLTAASKFSPQP